MSLMISSFAMVYLAVILMSTHALQSQPSRVYGQRISSGWSRTGSSSSIAKFSHLSLVSSRHRSPFSSSSSSPSSFALAYKNFDEMLTELKVPVLVDFYAQWCGPCQMMQPVLEDVANRLDNEAKVAKVDTDKAPKLGSRFQIEALPTLILFCDGQIAERFIGYRNADTLESEVREAIKRFQKK